MAALARIPLSVPHMSGQEQEFVREAFQTNWISTVGPHVNALEEEFHLLTGMHAVALSSGTAAIHLGLRLLGVCPGDTVLCSTLTFVASANPIRYLGAEPVFIDSRVDDWNLDPALLAQALHDCAGRGRLPRAVIVVDLYGQPADMHAIRAACAPYGVAVLDDAAEALGARYAGECIGRAADLCTFSLNGNKIITAGGGGVLCCHDRLQAERARFWSQQARDPGATYLHSELGYNYRMSNVLAAVARGQLTVLSERVRQRRAIAARYRQALLAMPGMAAMPETAHGLHTRWLSCFTIDPVALGLTRDALLSALAEANVEARPVWRPLHTQPLYSACTIYGGSVAEDLHRRGICLPSSSSLTEADQLRVVNTIRTAVGHRTLECFEDSHS